MYIQEQSAAFDTSGFTGLGNAERLGYGLSYEMRDDRVINPYSIEISLLSNEYPRLTETERDIRLIVTTDHGTIRVKTPSKVVGDRETTTNLRYKVGRNLQYERRDVLETRDPHKFGLPKPNVSSTFIFAKEDKYFLYPNTPLYKDSCDCSGKRKTLHWTPLFKRNKNEYNTENKMETTCLNCGFPIIKK